MKTKKTKQPTQRTLELLRRQGHEVAVVERWNPHAKVRQDLFGFIDVLMIPCWAGERSLWDGKPRREGVWAYQVTTASNLAARRTKAKEEPRLRLWLEAGNRFFLHGWKQNALGKWEPKEEEIRLEDLQ